MEEITIQELKQHITQNPTITIIDVREKTAFDNGTIAHAQNIPLNTLQDQLSTLPSNNPIYISCGGGTRSKKACALLKEQGIQAINVKGGFRAWENAKV